MLLNLSIYQFQKVELLTGSYLAEKNISGK